MAPGLPAQLSSTANPLEPSDVKPPLSNGSSSDGTGSTASMYSSPSDMSSMFPSTSSATSSAVANYQMAAAATCYQQGWPFLEGYQQVYLTSIFQKNFVFQKKKFIFKNFEKNFFVWNSEIPLFSAPPVENVTGSQGSSPTHRKQSSEGANGSRHEQWVGNVMKRRRRAAAYQCVSAVISSSFALFWSCLCAVSQPDLRICLSIELWREFEKRGVRNCARAPGLRQLTEKAQNHQLSDVRVRTADKYRMVYTDHQRLELEKEFHMSPFINTERKTYLSTELSLTERQIKIWFQNRWVGSFWFRKEVSEIAQPPFHRSGSFRSLPLIPCPGSYQFINQSRFLFWYESTTNWCLNLAEIGGKMKGCRRAADTFWVTVLT